MFEQVVANLLNSFLGDYIDNLETNQLNIGIWAGDVVLRNLHLKKDALDKFDVPFSIVQGKIGELTMKIPWNNLKGLPFRISIDNVSLLVKPRAGMEFSNIEEENRLLQIKKEQLLTLETLHTSTAQLPTSNEERSSYTSQLVTKIIANMQISIKNIHVRYDDDVSSLDVPFQLGFNLQELSIVSVNEDWEEKFIDIPLPETRKLLKLTSLALYWKETQPNQPNVFPLDEIPSSSHPSVSGGTTDNKKYILRPVTGIAKLIINKEYGLNVPKYDLTVEFEEFSLAISKIQYRNLWLIFNHFELYNKSVKYRRFKPPQNDRTGKTLWKFALDSILLDVHEKLDPFTYQYLDQRRKDRLRFIHLYKNKKVDGNLSPEEENELDALIKKFSLHDLALFTKMALKQVRAILRERVHAKPIAPERPVSSSWTSWLWSSPSSSDPNASISIENADLERILDYDESLTLQEQSLPQDCILYSVKWKTKTSCLFLQENPTSIPNFDLSNPLIPNTLSAVFDSFSASFISKLNKDVNFSVTIKDVCAFDALSSCNKEIIYSTIKGLDVPLFSLRFKSGETNQVIIDSQSLTIMYTPQTEQALSSFFTPPEQVTDSYKNISSSLKHQTRAGLEYTLSQHKATEIIIDAAAPVFLFPLSEKEVLVLDSGRLNVNTQLLDTDATKDLEGKQQMDEEEMKKLLSLMYDKYNVSFKNVKLVVGKTIPDCLELLKCTETTKGHIIDGLDFAFLLEISILPKAVNISKMKLSGSLPELNFNLSDRKYKSIMKAIDLFSSANSETTEIPPPVIRKESQTSKTIQEHLTTANYQDLVDFRFLIDKLRVKLSLYDAVLNEERDLALLSLDRLNIQFNQRKLDRHAVVSLHALHLLDLQQPIEALKPLIHSLEEAKELVLVNYRQYEDTSPDFTGFNQMVDLSFDSVKILLNRKSILDFYDFLMTTFVSHDAVESTETTEQVAIVESAPSKMQVKFHTKSIYLDFNEGEEIFANLSLGYSDFLVELDHDILAEGILGIVDVAANGEKLVSIQGERSADFKYVTGNRLNDDIFFSKLNFQTESMHLLYRPAPISRILGFLSEFAAMHSVMEVARRRAAETAADKKFGFAFKIQSPVVEHIDAEGRQLLVYLGELNAQNKYLSKAAANYVIDASLTNVKVNTVMQGVTQHVLDDIQLNVSMEGPQLALDLSEVELHLTHEQYEFLLATYYFLFPPKESPVSEPLLSSATAEETPATPMSSVSEVASAINTSEISMEISLNWSRLGLELLTPSASLVHFDLHGLFCKVLMTVYGTMEGEFGLQRFAILDCRSNDNVFKDILPLPAALEQPFAHQLICRFMMRPSSTFVSLALDSPQFLIMFDFIQQVIGFFSKKEESSPATSPTSATSPDTKKTSPSTAIPTSNASSSVSSPATNKASNRTNLRFQIKVTNAQAILVHKANDLQSNALVFGFSQLNLWHENSYSFQLDGLGIFICRMNNKQDKIRILQDVNLNLAMEYNPSSLQLVQGLIAHIDPILLRVSYQEALFLQDILQLYMNHFHPTSTPSASTSSIHSQANLPSPSQTGTLVKSTSTLSQQVTDPQIVSTSQLLNLHVQGLQIILIDDLHDLHVPMFDFNIEPFDLECSDWSTLLRLALDIKFGLNMWNPKNSSWEPAIESSSLKVGIKSGEKTKLDVKSNDLMNINITRQMLDTIYSTLNNWPTKYDTFHGHKRRPYVIRNRTGLKISIWDHSNKSSANADLEDGQDIPWHFEDWKARRDSTQKVARTLAIHIHGHAWETVELQNLDKEQSVNYVLRPRVQDKVYRMAVDVKVKDKLKIITLKSNFVFVNNTLLSMDFLYNNRVISIASKEEFSVPLDSVYTSVLRLRPPTDFGYLWSQPISWNDFLLNETHDLTCSSPINNPTFHFIAHAKTQVLETGHSQTPSAITVTISSPIEFENALPFEVIYQILERKNAPPVVSESVGPNKISSACACDISKTLGLQVKIPYLDLSTKELGLISSREEMNDAVELDGVKFDNGLKLNLLIETIPNTGHSRRVSLYSPFVILNRLSTTLRLKDQLSISILPLRMDLISDAKVSISFPDSEWSNPVVLNTLASGTSLRVENLNKTMEWHVGISVTEECCRFGLSKLIIFDSRFVLRNMTGMTLEWKQQGADDIGGTILANADAYLEYLLFTSSPNVQFRYPDSNLLWSAPISLQVLGLNHARMDPISPQDPLINKPLLLEVEVVQHEASLFMHIKQTDQWPFRIENLTPCDLQFAQVGHRKTRYAVSSGRSALYAWDDPTEPEKKIVMYYKDTAVGRAINLFEIGSLQPWELLAEGKRYVFAIDLHVDGTTRVLQLSNYEMTKSIYRMRQNLSRRASVSSTSPSTSSAFEVINVHSIVNTMVTIHLQLGISFNSDTEEILYISFKDLVFSYQDTNLYNTYRLDVHWLQIDNQLFSANEPIVLFPVEISKNAPSQHHTFQTALVKSKDQSHGIQYYKYFTCLLQEISFSVDQALVTALSSFLDHKTSAHITPWEDKTTRSYPNPRDQAALMYFEAFQIQPIKISVSFSASPSSNMSGNVFTFVTKILSMGLGNIHNLQLRLNSLTLEHPICTLPLLQEAIYNHYYGQIFGNIYKILGSVDFLGNPAGLFNNIASGVQGVFYEPFQGFVSDRPQDVGIGLAKGTANLVGKTVYGFADGFAKFTGAIGKGLATATLDEQFQQSRQISRARNRPKHAIYGVTAGTKSFARGVISGVKGVVTKPMEGAEKSGVGGFFKGMGKGIVGLAAKPMVGLLDMASNISEGIKNTTTVFDDETEIDRVRYPRFIDASHILTPYSEREALGQYWLKMMNNGAFTSKQYVAHLGIYNFVVPLQILELKLEDYACILTLDTIFMIRLKQLRVEWDLPISDVRRVDVLPQEKLIRIHIPNVQKNGFKLISGPDATSVEWFGAQIDKVFKRYVYETRPID